MSETIGTPLSPIGAAGACSWAPGELGKEVAIELQRFGCEQVIACDSYANAPAMQLAHRSPCLLHARWRDLAPTSSRR